jgi:hypothetical protein
MTPDSAARLINALHTIMDEVTQSSSLPADDPALVSLRRILLLRIADIRAAAEKASDGFAARDIMPDKV